MEPFSPVMQKRAKRYTPPKKPLCVTKVIVTRQGVSTFGHMKSVLALMLTGAFLFQIGVKTGVWGWYQWNKSYISQVLCENRGMPELKCDGKCVLAQKLKQAESQREDQPIPLSEINNEIAPCYLQVKQGDVSNYLQELLVNAVPPNSHYEHRWAARIFHPPRLV